MLDLTGQKFGRLTVIKEAHRRGEMRLWHCHCDCGGKSVVYQAGLRDGTTTSCGCSRTENLHTYHRKHGQCGTRTYKKWKSMHRRVRNSHLEKNLCYRGIYVCKRWRKFENFLKDMGEAPVGLTLERISNKRGYSPSNCRWATWIEQMNNHSGVRLITFRGKTQSMKGWADETGIRYVTLSNRLNCLKWPIKRALTVPV